MYDWAHGQSDSIEGVTHSICTLEYEDHRPLYDWYLDALGVYHPQQIEFARLNLSHTVMSKRKLLELVQEGLVSGWDDPRMPTLAGLRRRGYTPEAIRDFAERVGVAKAANVVGHRAARALPARGPQPARAERRMAVLRPLRLVIENYPEGQVEEMEAVNNPEDPARGHAQGAVLARALHRAGRLPRPARRPSTSACRPAPRCGCATPTSSSAPGVDADAAGQVTEVRCTYDPDSRGGDAQGPQGEGHHPLGVGAARRRRRGAALRHALHACPSPTTPTTGRTRAQPAFARGACAAPRLEPALARLPPEARASSSSARATSASTRATRRRRGRSSTARSDCATRGRRSKRVRAS